MQTPEQRIERYLKRRAEEQDMLCLKFTSGNAGVPDRVLIGAGRTLFIELKAPGKKPRRLQEIMMQRMREAGADVRVIDSQPLIDELITELLENRPR